jgi:hypothetical protein
MSSGRVYDARVTRGRTFGRGCFVPLFAIALAGCDESPHGLSRAQIEQTIDQHGTALKSCWKATGPHGELRLHVDITMNPDGHVESAVANSHDAAVNACLEKQIKGWRFAKASATTKFSLPVNFTR